MTPQIFEANEEMEALLEVFCTVIEQIRERATAAGDEFGGGLFAPDNPDTLKFTNMMSVLSNATLRVGTTAPELLALGMMHPMGMMWVLIKFATETGYMVGRASVLEITAEEYAALEEASEALAAVMNATEGSESGLDPLAQVMSQDLQDGEIVN